MINIRFSGKYQLLFLIISTCSSFNSFAQADLPKNILIESGIVTVSKTSDGKDMILFTKIMWDEMQKGTRYTSGNFCQATTLQFCMEITAKNKLQCRSGIGFACSVFDCPDRDKTQPIVIDASNRICSVMIQRPDNNTVKLIFLDKVNWESLQNETQ